ncbi:hypothetical protein Poly30_47600 [Planctomycetes bacterium Poly30]|uniref:Uncharacterized protein n=1 Tax=Saltatorellus ferox TaxID=2528018 RepID=A0A518EYP4_9BACT|nr:hypothetical protein Poly30_47600 [Planctomycetes bacterium Poly30]
MEPTAPPGLHPLDCELGGSARRAQRIRHIVRCLTPHEEEPTLQVLRMFGHRLTVTEDGRALRLNASYSEKGLGKLKRSDKSIAFHSPLHWERPSFALNAELTSAVSAARQNRLAHRVILVAARCGEDAVARSGSMGRLSGCSAPGSKRASDFTETAFCEEPGPRLQCYPFRHSAPDIFPK